MNDNKKENININYEPNFVMYDTEEPPKASFDDQTPLHDKAPSFDKTTVHDNAEAAAAYAREAAKMAQRAEAPKAEAPKAEAPRYEAPRYEMPKQEMPKAEAFAHEHVSGTYDDPRVKYANGDHVRWENGEVKINKVKPKKHKKSKPVQMTRMSLAFLVIMCMLFSGLCGFGGVLLGSTITNPGVVKDSSSSAAYHTAGYTLESATGSPMTIKEITSKCQPSVVEIKTESVASDSWMQQYVTQGAGSGVIISDDGYIMTNNHVIKGAQSIKVSTIDGTEYDAKLVGTDSMGDVAVIKINAKGLTPATYGNSDELAVGDLAVAIGNPLGELGGTVTAGIISATDRELSIDGKTLHLLQTDSSINPGNSGGGLFNGEGQFIGLVVAKSSGSDVEGLGFAIPINTAAEKAQQLMSQGYVSGQPFTGMKYAEGQDNSMFGMFGGSSTSVYIAEVVSNEAKLAGFQEGDQVFAIDDKQITSLSDVTTIVSSHKVGDVLKFTVVRDGMTKDLSLKLQERKGE